MSGTPTGIGNYPPGVTDNDPHFDNWGDRDEDDEPDYEHEWVLACGYPDCCMPEYHFRYECHNGEDIEAQNAAYEAAHDVREPCSNCGRTYDHVWPCGSSANGGEK